MIRIQRDRTKIPAAFTGPSRLSKASALVELAAAGPPKFTNKESTHWKKAKAQLKKEGGGKCAYCEAPTSVVAHGDVEHFRPKTVYWWLAYCYDNYTFACQICNQTFKGDKFPIGAAQLAAPLIPATSAARKKLAAEMAPDPTHDPSVKKFLEACTKEKAALPDPYTVDPVDLFAWEADENLKEVRLVAAKNTVAAKRAVAAAEEVLGLNREELRRERYRIYEEVVAFKKYAKHLEPALGAEAEALVTKMKLPAEPFAAVARFFGV